MEKFCLSIENKFFREKLYNAIKRKGAFRRFKDMAHEFDLIEDWYKFKHEAFKEIAIEWCEDNNIGYTK